LADCGGNAKSIEDFGIKWATDQCRDLFDRGVAGIHFYTLNKSDATRRIYQTLGLAGRVGAQGAG
ncbi:MAG: methylenetetrahydrofolate reductase, partial [Phycisphaerales bacterium]